MKVLILGVGNAQIDAIEYCKSKGHEVYGCSYTNQEKGICMLDHFRQINILDKEKVLKFVQNEKIDIVYSVGSDIAMPTVNYVSEKLDMPHFVSCETAVICNMKQKMREALGKEFEGNVGYIVAEKMDDLDHINFFPAIMKPVDSQGQRGVYKVNTLEEAKECFEKSIEHSKSRKVIVEQFLNGNEVSVNAYFVNGEMKFGLVSDRISYDEFPGGIIKEHLLPSQYSGEIQERIKDLAYRVAKKLGIANGPAYFQIKVVDEQPYLIEVTPRLDGCHMWRIIRYYTGVDLLDISFRHLIYNEVNEEEFRTTLEENDMELKFMCQAPGTEVKTFGCDGSVYSRWYYDDGEKVRKLNGYMEKCGYRIERV